MKKMRKFLAGLLTFCVLLSVITIFPTVAYDPVVQVIRSDNTVLDNYGSITAAHNAAVKAKINNYTIRLLKDFDVTTTTKINNTLASTWTLDGNGHSINCSVKEQKVLYFYGNAEAVVTIKRLNITAMDTCLYFESGNFIIESGCYTTTDPVDWVAGAVSNIPGNENESTVTITGGVFIEEYLDGNDVGKTQCAVRNFSQGLGTAIMNIYGGYFLSYSTSLVKAGDNVIYSGSYTKKDAAILNIYGGTFEGRNCKGLVTADYKSTLNLYGGNFIGDVYKCDGSVNDQFLINITDSYSKGNFYSGNFVGGGYLFRVISTERTGDDAGTFGSQYYRYYSVGKHIKRVKKEPEVSFQTSSLWSYPFYQKAKGLLLLHRIVLNSHRRFKLTDNLQNGIHFVSRTVRQNIGKL